MCGWMTDPRDGGAQWLVKNVAASASAATAFEAGLSQHALCLTATPPSAPEPWEQYDLVDSQPSADEPAVTARLWSAKFRSSRRNSAFQCMKFAYQITNADTKIADVSTERSTSGSIDTFHLAILRHSSG